MSEEPKRRKGRAAADDDSTEMKATKQDKAIASYLRSKLEEKEGKLVGMVVTYFLASEALDALMASKWADETATSSRTPLLFPSRAHALTYMQSMLLKQMFHRAEKVKKKARRKVADHGESLGNGKKSSKKKSQQQQTTEDDLTQSEATISTPCLGPEGEELTPSVADAAPSPPPKKSSREGKKARVKLEMHHLQTFVDGENIYVWLYEPIKPLNIILGLLVLIVVVICCLFPLWPDQLRVGAWYTSTVAMVLLGTLLALAALRGLLFSFIWLVTMGRHHFWLLPNLMEDCGVLDSFKPLYSHEYHPPITVESKSKSD